MEVVPGTLPANARVPSVSTPSPQQLHLPGTAAGCSGGMTGSDLIVIAPWIVFAATLAVVLARVLSCRRRGGRW
jgi:hypothetical protein